MRDIARTRSHQQLLASIGGSPMEKYPGRGVRLPVFTAIAITAESESQPSIALEIGSEPQTQPKTYPVRWDLMILLLAVAGGSVDGVMLSAFNALPGAQTGNTVLLGISLAHGQLPLAAAQTAFSDIC